MKIRIPRALIALVIGLNIFQPNAVKAQLNAEDQSVVQLITEFHADEGSLLRFYHIDGSPERTERILEFYRIFCDRLDATDFTKLSTQGKVDYILIKNRVENKINENVKDLESYKALDSYLSYGKRIYAIEKKRRRGFRFDAKELAKELDEISQDVMELSTELIKEKKLFELHESKTAKQIINGHLEAMSSVYNFYTGYDPDFSWWIKKPYLVLEQKLYDHLRVFDTQINKESLPADDGSGIIGNPIGRKKLIEQLESEFIAYSPEELVEIALKEFAWCDKEMLKVSQEMGFGKDWKKALEQVKNTYVPVGDQPQTMLRLYNESISFLKEKDLITIPPLAEETWRMRMISPEGQKYSPFFLGGEILQIAYPTDDMGHDEKLMSMRGNNPHFARAVIHHELIAGHHLQQFMNRRYKTHRNYHTPFWTEGWALYWELLLWDLDFPQSAEDKVGMLFWRMHRCARIIFSLNYHLGEWTPQQCIDYLVERVGHERANAESEVRRSFTGSYGPLYQIAYMTGGMQFYQLKKELVDSGELTLKEYHDAVMRENNMPVEMLRALLNAKDLKKDYKTSWKFYQK